MKTQTNILQATDGSVTIKIFKIIKNLTVTNTYAIMNKFFSYCAINKLTEILSLFFGENQFKERKSGQKFKRL